MPVRSLLIAALGLGAIVIAGPAGAAENWPDSVDQYVVGVRKSIATTDMDGYLAAVTAPNGALLLDVREEDEFKSGHVPGAVNLPRGLLEFRIWRLLGYPGPVNTGRKIYVQCSTGARATMAAKTLKDVGFTDVTAVIMRFTDWQARGYPLAK